MAERVYRCRRYRFVVTADDSDADVDADKADDSEVSPVDSDLSIDDFYEALQELGSPVVTASEIARALDLTQEQADTSLEQLADEGRVARREVTADPVVWYPVDWDARVEREHVIPFPDRREVVVEHPTQFTRAQLSQFAHLVDTSGTGGYLYRIRPEDVWGAPYDDLATLLRTVRMVLPGRSPNLEEWIEQQWKRARQFVLETHPDGYTVLSADNASLMGNVARRKLTEDHLRAPISDTESWVVDDAVAEIKRILYDAGFPVRDERELDAGDALDVDLHVELRDYQREWVDRFVEGKAGVLVGPPGSGKTIAGLGAMAAVGGETLILVPNRELATQWRESIVRHTSLTADQIGEYHGGEKQVRPVTIATYQVAGMDRHRALFDSRRWGLIVYDEVQHIPADVYRQSADLQGTHRLGLSATPVREDDRERDIFTLIGPPIGTDWAALFEAGFVAEPELEIRYVPWSSEAAYDEYGHVSGHERRKLAAMNPGKLEDVRRLRERHAGEHVLVFVDWLDQGAAYEEALDVPFVSGETRHAVRERLFDEFRRGERDTLVISRVGDEGIDLPDATVAILASGLGGSRRQGAQRAGRTMRPVGGARVYVLATRGTVEEDFARRQLRHLESKGLHVVETDVETEE